MSQDQLFNKLCKPELMRIGWYLAQNDSHDDFVADPIKHADFASNLNSRLKHIAEQVRHQRYRPHHLLSVDVPKSGLSVRPGNVLPIEEATVLHSIIYLLAPILDKHLDSAVYSCRLHPEYKNRIKKRDTIFRKPDIEFPFLKKSTIRSLNPLSSWYELWPDFEQEAIKVYTQEGYTHLTKTDITAYFENIDLHLLESRIRSLLGAREEDRLLQLLFRILESWTRTTRSGISVGRGIPQGNDISSFLANLYLIPLDNALATFCKKHECQWFRYVDDVKVFSKSERNARAAVFVINESLRSLHLNLQGAKTDILSGDRLKAELDNVQMALIDAAFDKIAKCNPRKSEDSKCITQALKPLKDMVSRYRKNSGKTLYSMSKQESRSFRRLLLLYGTCKRTQFTKASITAIRQLPDIKVLKRALTYLYQLDSNTHDNTLQALFDVLESDELPFPYQAATVLEAISRLHPEKNINNIGKRIRKYSLAKSRHWIVIQKGIEAISVYPYPESYALNLASTYIDHEHPLVSRAACVLLTRGPKDKFRQKIEDLAYHPDYGVNRLSLYFQRLHKDKEFSAREISRIRNGAQDDIGLQRALPRLYAMGSSQDPVIATSVNSIIHSFPHSKSKKMMAHRKRLTSSTEWASK